MDNFAVCFKKVLGNLISLLTNTSFQDVSFIQHFYFKVQCISRHLNISHIRSVQLTMYEGWNFNNGNYLFTTDTK